MLTGDEAADMATIAGYYADVHALYPDKAAPIRLADSAADGEPSDRKQA
jgi:hypothetical protein